jgi:hypothetical protein
MATTTLYVTSTASASRVTLPANLLGAPDDAVTTASDASGRLTSVDGIFTYTSIPDNAIIYSVTVGIRTAKTTGADGGTNNLLVMSGATAVVETFTTPATTTGTLANYEFTLTNPTWMTVAALKTLRLRWTTLGPSSQNKVSIADAMWVTVTTADYGSWVTDLVTPIQSVVANSYQITGVPNAQSASITYGINGLVTTADRCIFNLSAMPDASPATRVQITVVCTQAGTGGGTGSQNAVIILDLMSSTGTVYETLTGPIAAGVFSVVSTRSYTPAELKNMQVRWSGKSSDAYNGVIYLDAMNLGTAVAAPAVARVHRWDGSAWVESPIKRWSGSAWVTTTVKRWDGSAWV